MDEVKKPEHQKPNRIPVNRFQLHEGTQLSFPGGMTLQGRVDCLPQEAPGRAFRIAHFNPSHQVIEIEVYKNEKEAPYRARVAMNVVVSFD